MSQKQPSPSRAEAPLPGGALDTPAWAFPLLLLLAGAAFWLVVSSGFSLIASIKFHSANFLADCAELTYGRVRAVGTNAFLYGFCVPAGTAFGLWQFARLGRSRLPLPGLIAVGTGFWHVGVATGLLGILRGDLSGFENLEMPGYAVPLLFLGIVVLGLWGCLALHERQQTVLEASHWYSLAALFWFPWIFSTASLLLFTFPLRGIAQSVIAWWYSGNLLIVWMGLVGLGALLALLPLATGSRQRHLALFIFWTLLLFGSWVGIPSAAPLPAWMPVTSRVFTVLLLVPACAVAVLLVGSNSKERDLEVPPFLRFAGGFFVLYGLIVSIGAFLHLDTVTQFTWFKPALEMLGGYGFFGFAIFGAIYSVLPKLLTLEWPYQKLIRAHFYLALAGLLFATVPWFAGGVVQGLDWRNPNVSVVEVSARALKFLRPATLGEFLIALGNVLFLVNVGAALFCYIRRAVMGFIARTIAPAGVGVKL